MVRLKVGQKFKSKEYNGVITIENTLPMDYWNHAKVIITYHGKTFIVTENFIRGNFDEVKE